MVRGWESLKNMVEAVKIVKNKLNNSKKESF